jgi:hypothetical protein
MVKIILEQAENGVIKTIYDNNINGAGEEYESKILYVFQDKKNFKEVKSFFFDTCTDLGIEVGNNHDKSTLNLVTAWGSSYTPTKEDYEKKIKSLETELAYIKSEYNESYS